MNNNNIVFIAVFSVLLVTMMPVGAFAFDVGDSRQCFTVTEWTANRHKDSTVTLNPINWAGEARLIQFYSDDKIKIWMNGQEVFDEQVRCNPGNHYGDLDINIPYTNGQPLELRYAPFCVCGCSTADAMVKYEYTYCFDFDGDGYKSAKLGGDDCDDTDSSVNPGASEIPGNSLDENCDGRDLITQCSDGLDNDGDQLKDIADPGCSGPLDTFEGDGTTQCQDGIDNDNDGFRDFPDDISCSSRTDDSESIPMAQCQDGIDNDQNGYSDYPDDPGCTGLQDNSESGFQPDIEPPEISVLLNPSSPTNMQNILFTATANDDNQVEWVRIYVDGQRVCSQPGDACSTQRGPYSLGAHSYYAQARDSSGNTGSTGMMTFTVSSAPLNDQEPPAVNVNHYPFSPQSSESVKLTATATDNVGVAGISIFVDGSHAKTCTAGSACVFEDYFSQGSHTYYAEAIDGAGNEGISGFYSFVVGGGTGPVEPTCGVQASSLYVSGNNIYYTIKNSGSGSEQLSYELKVNGNMVQSGTFQTSSGSSRDFQKYYAFGEGSHSVVLNAYSDCGAADARSSTWTVNNGDDDHCTSGWLSSYTCSGDWTQRLYRESDCDTVWRNYNYCQNGCISGRCTIDSDCSEGWKCKDGYYYGYQNHDCSWSGLRHSSSCTTYPSRCDVEIRTFDFSGQIEPSSRAFIKMGAVNSGSNSATVTYEFYVDDALAYSTNKRLDPSTSYTKTHYFYPAPGLHDVEVVAKTDCGDEDRRLAQIHVGGTTPEPYPIPDTSFTGISLFPSQLDLEGCDADVITLSLTSTVSQVFTINVEGMRNDWLSYPSSVHVPKGKKDIFIYVSPMEEGKYTLNIDVKALGEQKDFSRVATVFVSPEPNAEPSGSITYNIYQNSADGDASAGQGEDLTGLVVAGDYPFWLVILILLVIAVAVLIVRERNRSREDSNSQTLRDVSRVVSKTRPDKYRQMSY